MLKGYLLHGGKAVAASQTSVCHRAMTFYDSPFKHRVCPSLAQAVRPRLAGLLANLAAMHEGLESVLVLIKNIPKRV